MHTVQQKVWNTALSVASFGAGVLLVAGCSGGGSGSIRTVTTTVTATEIGGPSTADAPADAGATRDSDSSAAGPAVPDPGTVQTWPVKWCQAQPGITKQQLVDIMGPPTSDFGPESGSPSSSWDYAEYQFNAFYDVDGNVRQLDINDISLTDSEKAALTCEGTRTA